VSFALEEPLSDRSALAEGVVGANPIEPQTYLVEPKEITKAYGPTLAAADIDFAVAASDVIGLVGGSGAGKSTLMRILCGITAPTLGRLSFDGAEACFTHYDAGAAQRRGIRMVHQELSLCATLTVAENFFVEDSQYASAKPGWRNVYRSTSRAALDAVCPGNAIDVNARIDRLSIGERQMVEIARATATPGVCLIVLDEPTSSLDLERSRQLCQYVRERARAGLAFIFINHKLHEIMDVASRVLVLRNGRVAWQGEAQRASVGKLVELMGGDASVIHHRIERETRSEPEMVHVGGDFVGGGAPLSLRKGEIVGLAGLQGHGQKALLRAIHDAGRGSTGAVTRAASASFVSGDRQKEGVFPLWSVLANISIGRVGPRPGLGLVSDGAERLAASPSAERIRLDLGRLNSRIGELSGGNQQKALVSRAVAAETPIVLLDDPTRGVDIGTKQDFYRLCSELAREGRTLIWHTTEDAELLACDRVLVFANGKIVRELSGSGFTEEAIVAASFSHLTATEPERNERSAQTGARLLHRLVDFAPLLGLALVLAVMIAANPGVASVFGVDLLLLPALSLVLVTEAQMFVVGGGEIDLGVGAFAGLVSVLGATLLYDRPAVGLLAIAAALSAYALIGAIIHSRKIPAIVVTLGASLIWAGIGYSIQPTPGGASPDWLSALTSWSISAYVPTSIVLIGAVAAIGALLDWAPLGVVLRGFGANPAAMIASGWPPIRYGIVRYLVAGLFSAGAGLSLTSINASSDINSGNSYTLLSVAAVVMGGCALTGGVVALIGAVVGAVTLALIGALLGALGVSSDFNAAAQGAVLIGLLGVRYLADRSGEE
jgi:ribose transport system ATP-binding protein